MRLRPTPVLLALALAGCAGPTAPDASGPPLEELSAGGYAMGTVLELTLLGPDRAALESARAALMDEVERLEALLSRWRPESEISRLNQAAGAGPIALDPEAVALLARCVGLSRDSLGAFDVTVGPLVRLWTGAAARNRLPAEEALAAARAAVGPHHIEIGEAGEVVLAAGSAVELGGVAKGYALDRARAGLGPGVHAALLNFGQSSTWAIGQPPGLPGWRLLVRAPEGGFAGMLTLRDQALSASGSLGQWSEIEGRHFGHVLDPRSGRPLERRQQALVVAGDATLAEALSTALLVLGAETGIALVETWPGVEALLLEADGRHWRTSGWDRVTRFEVLAPAPVE